MEIEKLKRKTIKRLKEIKEEQGLSINQIAEMLEARGQFVSEASLKKVFADGSEEKNFRYQDTIAPIADVLLDIYGDTSGIENVESLRQIIREKNKLIEFLMIKLEEQSNVYHSKDAMYQDRKSIYDHHIEQLESQIKAQNERLAFRDNCIERKDMLIEKLLNAYLLKEEEL